MVSTEPSLGQAPSRALRSPLTGYVGVVAVLVVAYYVFPDRPLELWTPIGLVSVVGLVVGIRLHRPRRPAAWYLLAAATLCFIAGDTTLNVLASGSEENPYPSWADPLYLLTYPLFAAGLLVMIRGRTTTRDRGSLLDAGIVTTGVGLLVWVYLVLPYFQAAGLTPLQRAVSVAYPLGDVLVLAMLARLATAGGLRIRSAQLLFLGAIGLLGSDIVYGFSQLRLDWQMGSWADLGWIAFYGLWGAAALHPSMPAVTEPVAAGSVEIRRGRIAVLAGMGLIAPVVLLVDNVINAGRNAGTVGAFSAVLYVLVLVRLAGIVAVHTQAVTRERILRTCGGKLVAAQDVDEITAAALTAVEALTSPAARAGTSIELQRPPPSAVAGMPDLRPDDEVQLWSAADAGGRLSNGGTLSISGLRWDHAIRGVLAVQSPTPIAPEVHSALTAVASQVALALESNRLAEDLRRRQSDAHFTSLIQNASDIILVVDTNEKVTHGGASLQRALGLASVPDTRGLLGLVHPDDAAAAGQHVHDLTNHPDHQLVADWRLQDAAGNYRSYEVVSKNMVADPTVAGFVFTMRDVSERRALEQQLKYQAFHDGLTGLPNRALFLERAAAAMSPQASGPQVPGGPRSAMVMLDLDDFKDINDTHGHGAGDDVLRAVGRRLQQAMRPGDTAARLGGDEFAVLVEQVTDNETADLMAGRILESFVAPFVVNDEVLFVHASAGLVVAGGPDDDVDLAELLLRADLALYAAKERGKGQFQRYEAGLRTVMLDRVTRRIDLKRAVEQEEFFLQYQPIVRIETGEVVGAEALVRWHHPRLGLVPPNDFIQLAEETGLIVPLGRWVLDAACAQAKKWEKTANGSLRMCVNVSGRQLQEAGFVDEVRETLVRHDIVPASLVLELTETVLFHEDSAISQRLAGLKQLGVKIAIDDFGTGYSSLGYLQNFAVDILKVDKSFIDGLGQGSADAGALAQAMVSLAHLLRLEIVAEGIEHVEQRDELWSLGCGLGQGFFYSKPLSVAQLSDLLDAAARLGGPLVRMSLKPLTPLPPGLPAPATSS